MTSISCLSEESEALIIDASVVVNINATGYADRILSAYPGSIFVPKPVVAELERGARLGHQDAVDLHLLFENGIARSLPISKLAQSTFVSLVSGSSVSSLGDGEAATIACAFAAGAWAVIDERKARKICLERYKEVNLASTVDILGCNAVVEAFKPHELGAAIEAALEVGRMQVQAHHLEWVLRYVRPERLERCASLSRRIRERAKSRKAS